MAREHIESAKSLADILQDRLSRAGRGVKRSEALEIIAALTGGHDWNRIRGALKRAPAEAVASVRSAVPAPAWSTRIDAFASGIGGISDDDRERINGQLTATHAAAVRDAERAVRRDLDRTLEGVARQAWNAVAHDYIQKRLDALLALGLAKIADPDLRSMAEPFLPLVLEGGKDAAADWGPDEVRERLQADPDELYSSSWDDCDTLDALAAAAACSKRKGPAGEAARVARAERNGLGDTADAPSDEVVSASATVLGAILEAAQLTALDVVSEALAFAVAAERAARNA